jgi:hypothetical protein
MTPDTLEAAQYHADRGASQQAAFEGLLKARALGLEETECMAIAYECGFATDFEKEIRK